MTVVTAAQRRLPDRTGTRLGDLARSWEALLLLVGIAVFVANSWASPYFLDPWNLSDATFNFTEKAIVALAMAFIVVSGEIDLSVAAIMALASTAMGAAAEAGAPAPLLVAVGLLTGLACGAVNGVLVTVLGFPSIVVTIGTMSLFRGGAYVVLGDGVYKGYPPSFAWLGQGYVWWVFSFEILVLTVAAVFAGVMRHATVFGRRVAVIGCNAQAALFSGVPVRRIKLTLFLASGLASGLAAVLLTARLGSTRPSIAQGWELEVVTMVVLGGVAISGGSGSIPGVVLAAFVIGLVTFGLGLLNVPGIVMSIFTGLLLVAVIATPILARRLARSLGPS